jgi:conjugative transfer signal peptidase TraF
MIRTNKKSDRSVEVADPDFGGAGVEVEETFFGDFGGGIGRRKNLDADLWCPLEKGDLGDVLLTLGSEPGDIGGFDACGGGDRTLGQGAAVREKLAQQSADMYLAFPVERSWRRAHDDVAVLVGLDAVGEPGELRIGQDLGPASDVKARLRSQIGKLDSDRHGGTIHQKMGKSINSKQGVKRLRCFALGCLAGVAAVWAACASGLRVNGTDSEPVGIYWAIAKTPAKGGFVFAQPPAEPIFKLAKQRGYLAAGPSPAGTRALIKQVAAVGGDRVTIDTEGVRVNGIRLKNSAPRAADEAGRPMRPYYLSDYTLRATRSF